MDMDRKNEPDFVSVRPVCLHCTIIAITAFLFSLFVVKTLLGGILQAVLKYVVPTYPERKRSSLDLKLENNLCWIVVTLTMIVAPWILFTVYLIAIGPDLG